MKPSVLGVELYRLIAMVTMPTAIVKTGISVLHGFVASLNLATIDVNERAAAIQKNE